MLTKQEKQQQRIQNYENAKSKLDSLIQSAKENSSLSEEELESLAGGVASEGLEVNLAKGCGGVHNDVAGCGCSGATKTD